jgi:hypothetical protein
MERRPIAIEHVSPSVDDGRYPVKREGGDRLVVWADVFEDGHEVPAAVKDRAHGETHWRASPMAPVGNDRWEGVFTLDANTRYAYTVEAWTDMSGSWGQEMRRRPPGGQGEFASELAEGRELVERARRRAAGLPDAGGPGGPALPALGPLQRVRAGRGRGRSRDREAPQLGEVRDPRARLGRAGEDQGLHRPAQPDPAENPALQIYRDLRVHRADSPHVLFFSTMTLARDNVALAAVNLDPFEAHQAVLRLPLEAIGIAPEGTYELCELLSGARRLCRGATHTVWLDPAVTPAHAYRVGRRRRRGHDFDSFTSEGRRQ